MTYVRGAPPVPVRVCDARSAYEHIAHNPDHDAAGAARSVRFTVRRLLQRRLDAPGLDAGTHGRDAGGRAGQDGRGRQGQGLRDHRRPAGREEENINVSVEGDRVAISAEMTSEKEVKEGDKLLHTGAHGHQLCAQLRVAGRSHRRRRRGRVRERRAQADTAETCAHFQQAAGDPLTRHRRQAATRWHPAEGGVADAPAGGRRVSASGR
ncbi:MAG: hypothetical protein MZW92_77475 [Comamonadaceae bacterium]|nr:hypothetical protein [Comamonadaceae bacterium]